MPLQVSTPGRKIGLMPLDIVDHGKNNVLLLAAETQRTLQGRITLQGDDNRIEVGGGCTSNSLKIELGSCCDVNIGSSCILGHLFVFGRAKGKVQIGSGSGFNGLVRL